MLNQNEMKSNQDELSKLNYAEGLFGETKSQGKLHQSRLSIIAS